MTSTPLNPDERDLLDFADAVAAGKNPQPMNDMERTYLHVHHAMQGEHGAIPADLKQSTWEDVMSTLSLTPDAPVSNRTRRQRGLTSPPRISRPKRLQWTPMASIAAAVLVVLASVGIWRINTMPNESLPPLAPQLAGITSGADIALVAATPEATAVEDESGNISIPIVQNVDEKPFDGPVIWLTTFGEVLYDDGSGEVATIATGAFQVSAQTTNVIKVLTHAPEKDSESKDGRTIDGYTVTYHHLVSGKTLVDDRSFSSYLGGPNTFGPLMVLTIADAPQEWSIVNFETMESRSISELTGGQFRSSDSITVAVSNDHSTIAIATSTYESEGSALLNRQSGLPGEVAVIPSELGEPSWVTVPEGMSGVNNISLSPDGSKIAFISSDNFRGGSNMTIAVVDVATGDLLVRTQRIESSTFSHFQWVEGGSAFVVIADKTVQKFAMGESEPTVIFETEGTINQMPQFGVDNLLHLLVSSDDLLTTSPQPDTTQFVILDTTTGHTVTVDGIPWYMGASHPVQMTRTLAPVPVSQDGKTAVLVHPITGEVYPDLVADVYDPLRDPDFEPVEGEPLTFVMPVVTAATADTSVITLADGNLAVFNTNLASMDATIIETPQMTAGEQLLLSPDGTYLIVGGSWESQTDDEPFLVLNLTDSGAEWLQGQPGQRIDFAELVEP